MPQAHGVPRGSRRRPARLRQPRLRRNRAGVRGVLITSSKTVLGVDPGSYRTGWGVLAGAPERPRLIACGEVRLDPRAPFPERLYRLHEDFVAVVRACSPATAAVEAPFHGVSARAALQLAHARGVILAALAAQHVQVIEYAPAVIKKTVAGSGRADKSQIQAMVRHALGDQTVALTSDLADALAAALCHLTHARFEAAVGLAITRKRRI